MSESSGFFVSQNGDRVYTPDWLAEFIKALVTTGVYSSELGVTAGTGMDIVVAAGRAWVEGYLYHNDTPLTKVIATADSALHRIDSIVVRLNMTDRTITTEVLTGSFSTDPVAPEITRTADIYDLKIAEIRVNAGTTKIDQTMITDTRLDDAVCGITVSAVQHIPTADYLEQMLAEFNAWFDYVKGILGEDEAGNLLQMIEALRDDMLAADEAIKAAYEAADTALQKAIDTKITAPTTGSTGQYLQKTATGVQWVTIKVGPTIHTGTTVPSSSLGANGDFYIKTR